MNRITPEVFNSLAGAPKNLAKSKGHADRNRLAVVLSFGVELRACEIAAITVGDVVDSKGNV